MTATRPQDKEAECGRCEKTGHLLEFNGVSLCEKCFDAEITAFVEGRKLELRPILA